MARHQRMPPQEAGYTYAVEPTAVNSLLANEEESIYGHLSARVTSQILLTYHLLQGIRQDADTSTPSSLP